MTINIALLTSDVLVFGCDSIASTSTYMVDPFSLTWQKDAQGNALKDAQGNQLIAFEADKMTSVVTNAWGGVTKMFHIHELPTPVVAVTSGLAKFGDGRTVKSLAEEFVEKQKQRAKPLVNVLAVANEFMRFFRKAYENHYAGSPLPSQYWDDLNFLVGGYGKADAFPSLFRINIKDKVVKEQFAKGNSGVAWEGQSDSVERLIRGYDGNLKASIESYVNKAFTDHHNDMTAALAKIVNQILTSLGATMPLGVDTSLPASAKLNLPWDSVVLPITYGNLPAQDAVDFVSFLVNIQSGKSKFAYGVATVGGRTHIGVVTKGSGFSMLEEPQLKLRNKGFGDDV